jgi:hypothetical protein
VSAAQPAHDSSTGESPDNRGTFCPSAQPDMEGAVAFGIVGGTAERPVVSYLTEPQPVTPELLALSTPVRPTEVFRFGAPCAERGCQHFDGAACELGRKIAEDVPDAVDRLPKCRLRPSCRWWHEQGRAACLRCPVVVTTHYRPSDALREAADPTAR